MEKSFRETVPQGTLLIETFGWWPGEGARRWPLHRDRLCRSAKQLGFPFPASVIDAHVAAITATTALRCRLTLDAVGEVSLSVFEHVQHTGRWRVTLSEDLLDPDDPWLSVKTTQRALYDRTRQLVTEPLHEIVFTNTRGEICEGTMTNIFIVDYYGARRTPSLACGLLPGVLRETKITEGFIPSVLTVHDILKARSLMIGNSLRGLMEADLEA